VLKKYYINGNYSLSDLENESEIIIKKFDAGKLLDKLNDIDYIILERVKHVSKKVLFSNAIVVETIKK